MVPSQGDGCDLDGSMIFTLGGMKTCGLSMRRYDDELVVKVEIFTVKEHMVRKWCDICKL